MKKFNIFFLVMAFFITATPIYAQLQKGTWMVRNGISPESSDLTNRLTRNNIGSYNRNLTTEVTSAQFLPNVGYLVTKNLEVGARFGYSGIFGGTVNFDYVFFSPAVHLYLNPNSPKFNAFLNLEGSWLKELGDPNYLVFERAFGASAGVGGLFFIRPDIGWETQVNYLYSKYSDLDLTNKSIGVSSSLLFALSPSKRAEEKGETPDIDSGSWMVGGSSASFNSILGEDSGYTLSIQPKVGFFVTENYMAGMGIAIERQKTGDEPFVYEATSVVLNPHIRYYFGKSWLRLFGGAGYSFGFYKSPNPFGGDDSLDLNTSLNLFAGANLFLTSNVALELAPTYQYSFEGEAHSIGFDLGLNYFLHQ